MPDRQQFVTENSYSKDDEVTTPHVVSREPSIMKHDSLTGLRKSTSKIEHNNFLDEVEEADKGNQSVEKSQDQI